PSCPEAVNLITSWIAPSGAYYWASAALAKNSSEADRSALKTAFASLLFPPTSDPWMSTFAAEQGQGSPRLVLDTATFQGVPLSLVVYLDHYKSPWIGVSAPIGSVFGGSAVGVGSGSGPPPPIDNSMSSSSSGAVVYGDASLDVVRAAIKTAEGKTFPATIVQVPTTVGIDRNAVWGFVDGPTQRADAIGYDANGNLLGNPTFATAPPDVIATGNDPIGGAWTLSITHDTTGDGLAFAWGTGAGGSGCCLGPQKLRDTDLQLDGTTTGGGEPSVVTAFASTSVTRVVAKFPVGSFDGQLFPFPAGYMGPAQVVVAIIPARVSLNGQLIAYDAAGNELVRVPLEQPACC
ncbi:MAG: hypothetical protein ACXVEI_13275, partial [Actinomycetota bacterium]